MMAIGIGYFSISAKRCAVLSAMTLASKTSHWRRYVQVLTVFHHRTMIYRDHENSCWKSFSFLHKIKSKFSAYLTFKTPFNGDFDFFRFGVLLPISIISISCVRPVLPDTSSMRLSIVCFRFAPLQLSTCNMFILIYYHDWMTFSKYIRLSVEELHYLLNIAWPFEWFLYQWAI